MAQRGEESLSGNVLKRGWKAFQNLSTGDRGFMCFEVAGLLLNTADTLRLLGVSSAAM